MTGLVLGLILGVIVLNALLTVGMIGKPRKPIDQGTAVGVILINGLIAFGVIWLAS